MKDAHALFRLLGDGVRLRILRLLGRARLNVSELTAILGIAQPGVSRHLRLLREAGVVEEQQEQGWTYYVLRPLEGPLGRTWRFLGRQIRGLDGKGDDARLQEVLRQREEERPGGRTLEPGKSWAAWARALGRILPPLRVADLACGEGRMAMEVARWASSVVAVDLSREALDRARARALKKGIRNIVWKRGNIEDLPLADASVDVAILSQALHHAEDPPGAAAEAARILAPGGTLLILDLKIHGESWVRKLGDRWLGFEALALRRMIQATGLRRIRVEVEAHRRGDPFQVLVASGRKER